jgi:protein-disulfide isomerase
MIRRLTASALALGIGLAAPAHAFDMTSMTDAERDQFRNEVRSYLMDNPEVIIEAVNTLEARQAEQAATDDKSLVSANSDALFDDGYSWVGGNPDGDVTVVEFFDYRCGYCRKAHDEVKELVSSDGNIRYIIKEFPILGEDSLASSRFAIATKQVAGDEAYAAVYDTLMSFNGEVTETALRRISDTLGLDVEPILAKMDSDEVTAVIQETRELAQRLQINGTPTFVMQDQMLRGYVPLNGMRQVVEGVRENG